LRNFLYNFKHILGFANFPHLTKLKKLFITGASRLKNEVFAHLQHLTQLETLSIDGSTDISSIEQISHLKMLKNLGLSSSSIDDEQFRILCSSFNLYKLSVAECLSISDYAFKDLYLLTNLKTLNISNTLVHELGLSVISKLTKLTNLSVAKCDFGSSSLKYMHDLRCLSCLDLHQTSVHSWVSTRPYLKHLRNTLINTDEEISHFR